MSANCERIDRMPENDLVCSARGCRAPAVWAVEWRNPKIHDETRVKTWLACHEHRQHLSDFLTRRQFPCQVRALDSAGGDAE